MIRFTTVAAACVLALSSTSVLAAAQSSATISGLNFTLIDLTPRDGIAPSFSFLSSVGTTMLTINATDNLLGEVDSAMRKRAGTFSFTNEFLADLTNASASASVNSSMLSVSGTAFGPQTSYGATASTGSNSDPYYYYPTQLNLSLSANSLLLIEANASLTASATNPSACGYYYYCESTESASATASLSLAYNYSYGNSSASFNDQKSSTLQATARGATTGYDWVYDPVYGYSSPVFFTIPATQETKSFNDVLTTVFTNSSGMTQLASLGLSVSVSGYGTTAPIPEPEAYALAMAGLGIVGLLARRRRG